MKVLSKPLTIQEIQEQAVDNYIEGVVAVALSEIIERDFEGFLDLVSEALVGSSLLMNVNYSVVGNQDEYTVLINVSGDVSSIVRDKQDEQDVEDKEEEYQASIKNGYSD
ncbi:hypothetical protein PP175_25455 (plasmid) [Aneurinibacillus sp. Ricciae_BoGa-3]|uniref:hypothetical protein n=1 Tax=Aneurinibacillus sp. Ricciae_BoGa-3 TaxID=3022697 RepID=UPI00234032FC|nr:hypothetical protein [Aneurinibacillus sp. Ricciae_BoGa-3]WCK57417.1 hypothetical protein PP175_25455 [Aneurinibacillus sp. Ricciae_BoGa-3]